jgi:hypothetical protein
MQAAQAPESRWHSNVEPGSEEEKENDAEPLAELPLGPAEIVVSGAAVSRAGGGGGDGGGGGGGGDGGGGGGGEA